MSNPNLKENKFKRALALPFRGLIKAISPSLYVKLQYRYITHHKCNLKHPIRYTEKLQYLRLYVYPKWPLVNQCAGRVGVRDYVESKGYVDALIPVLGIYDSVEEVPWDTLPDRFVMKCSHASGFNLLVRDKSKVDWEAEKKRFRKWLKNCI